jgi:hypothetical protein
MGSSIGAELRAASRFPIRETMFSHSAALATFASASGTLIAGQFLLSLGIQNPITESLAAL